MPTKAAVHTFKKGMVKDLDRSLLTSDAYLDANNFRIVTGLGESTGALENIEGNHLMNPGVNNICPDEYQIAGSCLLRDLLVLFITNETNSKILTVTFYELFEEINTVTTIYDDAHNGGTGTLDFSINHPIKAIGRYETPNIQKVYWTDGYNNIRYVDIAKNLTVTGDPYTADDYMPVSMFEFLPMFTPSKPALVGIVGGSLMSGMVQYSYQLYRLNGSSTAFSPVSDMIHVVSTGDFSTNTIQYIGDEESKQTGKGFRLSIVNNDTGYNRLRLVRVHYSSFNSVPSINIASEIEISTSPGTITVTDVGDSVDSLTLDEFNIASTELFKCEDIASKNNRLFAANIEKSEFTIDDWDARAVRFNAGTGVAVVTDGSQPDVTILDDLSNWDDPSTGYPADHDGINNYNDPDNNGDSAYAYAFQSNGTTLGAEGPNIKIDFETENFYLDISNNDNTFYTTPPTIGSDLSYKDYASPWKDGKLSWQRGEVYRLFVVFGNDRGQTADPKWICDLKMPSFHSGPFPNSSSYTVFPGLLASDSLVSNTVMSARLYPRVYFKTFPTDATWAQIYRVKRERQDRSIVTQALALSTLYDGVTEHYSPDDADNAFTVLGNVMTKLVSPEININKDIAVQSNDYLEYVTHFTAVETGGWGTPRNYIYKFQDNDIDAWNADDVAPIVDSSPIAPALSESEFIVIDNKKYSNFRSDDPSFSKGCSGLLVAYDNASWSANGQLGPIVNYRANVFGSQYGGHTYEDRTLNVSIPCSDVITLDDVDTNWVDIAYGDTYINYFDVSTFLFDFVHAGAGVGDLSFGASVYVPLESSINCSLRYDTDASHITALSNDASTAYKQEEAGEYTFAGDTYIQETDLYLYNPVYSQQTAVQEAISAGLDDPNETVFDCLVKASNVKYNGELSDSWTRFGANEEIEVDSNFGEITAIENFRDKLLYWQTHGFGILAVNDRSLINEGSTSQLVLGTGGVLDRYDYISTKTGTNNKSTLITTQMGVYWFDPTDRSIYRFTDTLSNLTKNKLIQSFFNVNYMTDYFFVHGVYDNKYNEVIMTFLFSVEEGPRSRIYVQFPPNGGIGYDGYTIAFNEATDAFTSFYSFVPRKYIPYVNSYFTTYFTSNADSMYYHNSAIADRCNFYGTAYDSTIKMLFNEDYNYTKAFDNVFYTSNVYDIYGYEQQLETFDSMRCYNELQNTGYTDLIYETNLERREREWTTYIPRNAVNVDYPTDVDILDDTNLDTARLYRDRMRDKFLIVDLVYDNENGYRIVFPYFGIKYRLSQR